jgi:hypothetical protein
MVDTKTEFIVYEFNGDGQHKTIEYVGVVDGAKFYEAYRKARKIFGDVIVQNPKKVSRHRNASGQK